MVSQPDAGPEVIQVVRPVIRVPFQVAEDLQDLSVRQVPDAEEIPCSFLPGKVRPHEELGHGGGIGRKAEKCRVIIPDLLHPAKKGVAGLGAVYGAQNGHRQSEGLFQAGDALRIPLHDRKVVHALGYARSPGLGGQLHARVVVRSQKGDQYVFGALHKGSQQVLRVFPVKAPKGRPGLSRQAAVPVQDLP